MATQSISSRSPLILLVVTMTLNINQIQKIRSYHNQGLSIRQIARKTRTDKNTVLKYIHPRDNQSIQHLRTRLIEYDKKRIPNNISPRKS